MHADVMRECVLHVKSAQAAAQQETAPQPSSDMPLLVTHSSTSLKKTSTCMKARMKVLKALSRHKPRSAEARASVIKYLELHMPGCRRMQGKDSSDGAQEVAAVHLHMIHMVRALLGPADSAVVCPARVNTVHPHCLCTSC